jgi:hypothetical protein
MFKDQVTQNKSQNINEKNFFIFYEKKNEKILHVIFPSFFLLFRRFVVFLSASRWGGHKNTTKSLFNKKAISIFISLKLDLGKTEFSLGVFVFKPLLDVSR